MSLKFGVYLVEQRIISPEQFCGLVKIQQEALASLATVAIRKNMMTIKQVANVLDEQELTPGKSFIQIAIESDFLDRADAQQLFHEQQHTSPTIRKLVQECGLLTERQTVVLFQHYQKTGTRPIKARTVVEIERPAGTHNDDAGTSNDRSESKFERQIPRAPKYKQRPVVVSQYTSPAPN